jgi:transposase
VTVRSPAALRAATATEIASASSFLRPCPVESTRTRAAGFAGTSTAAIPSAANRVASDYDTVRATAARRDRLDAAIAAMAADSTFTPVATRLGCLRGVATLTSFGLAVELGDWHRLTGRSIGVHLGLVPTDSSSRTSRSQGSITRPATDTPAAY